MVMMGLICILSIFFDFSFLGLAVDLFLLSYLVELLFCYFWYLISEMSTSKNYKRHEKLFNENYTYRYNRREKDTVYYICVVSGCTGRAAVYASGLIKVTKEHDCIPCVIDQSVIKIKELYYSRMY